MPAETLGKERFATISSAARDLVTLAAEVGIRQGTTELGEIDLDGLEEELASFLDENADALVGASYDYLEGLIRKSMFRDLDDSRMAAAVSASSGAELLALAELAVQELEEVAEIKRQRDELEAQVFARLSKLARGALTIGLTAVLAI